MKLLEILLAKAKKSELSHFYILETSSEFTEAQTTLMEFVHEFIRRYYQEIEGHKQSLTKLMDHPDVLVLGKNDEEKKEAAFYSVLEAESLTRFFEWRPVQSKRKFAVVQDAHRINTIVANKWLKLLEEPPGVSTIFLLNPRKVKLLDTIHSRAIHLRLSHERVEGQHEEWISLIADLKEMTLSQFLEKYSKGELALGFWMDELLHWEGNRLDLAAPKEALRDWVKTFEEMETFHQPTATKWTLFYSHMKEHVLPRLDK